MQIKQPKIVQFTLFSENEFNTTKLFRYNTSGFKNLDRTRYASIWAQQVIYMQGTK